MAKSYAKRDAEQVRVSSLLATAARREAEEAPVGMSLDQYYLALGKAAKADYQNGLLTAGAYRARLDQLKEQYNALKGRADQ